MSDTVVYEAIKLLLEINKDKIVEYIKKRVLEVLDSGIAYRYSDLKEETLDILSNLLWLYFSTAIDELEEKEKITINRGRWIRKVR